MTQEALAQPEQEPVACIFKGYLYMAHEFQSGQVPVDSQPLYTTPPQRTWVGLTDEEVQDAGRYAYCRGGTSESLYCIMWNSQPSASVGWCREELISFAQAVEAKYREKNQ